MNLKKFLMIGLTSSLLLIPNDVSAAPAESTSNATVKSENVSEAKVPEDEVAQLENSLGLNHPFF